MKTLYPIRHLLPCTLALSLVLQAFPVSATGLPSALEKANQLLKAGKGESAGAIYQAYWQRNPGSVESALKLAEIAMRSYEYDRARNILETSLARNPNSAETASTLGYLFLRWLDNPVTPPAGSAARVREHMTQALAMAPDNPVVLVHAGEWHLFQKDLVSAEKNFQRALQRNPKYVPAFQGLTRFYMQVRDTNRARESALHAMELDPVNSETYFLLAQLLANASRPAEAVTYAQKSQMLDFGRRPDRDQFLAQQYEKLGEWEQAVRYYENLSGYAPQDARIWEKLAELYSETNHPDKSKQAFERALALNPSLFTKMVQTARLATRNEQVDQALSQWQKLLPFTEDPAIQQEALSAMASLHYHYALLHQGKPHPGNQTDWQWVASRYFNNGNADWLQLAKIKWQMAARGNASTSTNTRDVLLPLIGSNDPAVAGEAYFLLGEYAKASEKLDRVDGLSAEAYAALADRLYLANELVYSSIFYQRAYELQPDATLETAMKRIHSKQQLAQQKIELGNQLFGQKNYAEALTQYELASQIYPQLSNTYLRMADTHEHLKQWQPALKAYETAISITPSLQESEGLMKNIRKLQKRLN